MTVGAVKSGFLQRFRTLPWSRAKPLRILVRQSPDWRNTPYQELIESSRSFLRMIAAPVGLPENFISEIVSLWDRTFKLTFFDVRAKMKDIAQENLAAVKNATATTMEQASTCDIRAEPVYLFIDDDDWLHPDIYRQIKPHLRPDVDGYVFGNILCVSHIELRALGDGCYTNNYAISGRFLQSRNGDFDCVAQHWAADASFHWPEFRLARIPLYVSATNKHPASTMKLKDGLHGKELSAATLRRLIEKFVDETARIVVPSEAAWVEPYTRNVRKVFVALL